MTRVPPRPLRTLSILGLVTVLVAVAVLLPSLVMPPASPSAGPTVSVRDETPALDGVFDPGIILAAASNGSATLLGGIGVYTKLPRDFSLPVLAELLPSVGGAHAVNLTAAVNQYFYAGGIYAIGWNGTAWLIAGQATWNGTNYGTAVAMTGSGFRNLTPAFEPFFVGGGIFAVGWNGTSWLLGGNSTSGVALVALRGTSATGLSSRLPSTAPDRWLQLLQWNGAEWLVGGEGVFGTLDGTDFTNLLGATPFAGTGAWAGAGDGTGWIAGGGGGRLVVVGGSGVTVVPPLTSTFDQAALMIIGVPGGYLVGGKGLSAQGRFMGELVFWNGRTAASVVTDWTAQIPSSFAGGEIQGGASAAPFGSGAILLVGEGSYENVTGAGVGAIALASLAGA